MESQHIELKDIATGELLEREYKKRRQKFVYKKIVKQDLEPFFKEGWQKGSISKKSVRLKKLKDIGVAFEDDLWCTLYQMGFYEMNLGQNFLIPRYKMNVSKQIDIFARDDQCVIIIDCKAAEEMHTKKSLGLDIDQLPGIKHELEASILSHYRGQGNKEKIRIAWIIALKNIDISQNDIERARSANIKIFDETILDYYKQLANHLGPSARYQFLSDLFPNRDIPNLLEPIPAIKGQMGSTVFYSFLIEPEILFKIAYVSHRAKTNEETIKTYQRMVQKKRLKNIAEYIHEKSGIFPTSIVINIHTDKPLQFNTAPEMAGKNAVLGTLHLPNKFQTAWIIDGQHRLFAYSGLKESKTATLPVIAFENLPADIQAKLFVDINGEQVKVSKNLLIDLYANLNWNSIDPKERLLALISRLIKEFNENPKSPFRDRIIKVDGKKTKTRNLTNTAFSDELIGSRLLGYKHSRKATEISPGYLYQEDIDSTFKRAFDVIIGYYNIFLENEKIQEQWNIGSGEGGYICTNLGIIATLRILREIMSHLEHKISLDVRSMKVNSLLIEIKKYIDPVISYLSTVPFEELKQYRIRTGQSGVDSSTFNLLVKINSVYPDFEPVGLKDFLKRIDTTNNEEAFALLSKIEITIHEHVIGSLKTQYGANISEWWHKGVKESVRKSAREEAEARGDYNSDNYPKYLYLINLKEIINDNWTLFSEIYTIDAKKGGSKKSCLNWLDKINNIRNICDHPPQGGVSDSELDYVKMIHNEITNRVPRSA